MNFTDLDILQLIPQRPPMVMLNRLVYCEGPVARAVLMIKEDNVFSRDGYLTESGMIEAMAQTAAARTGWINYGLPGEKRRSPAIGVIGSVKDFRLIFLPRCGQEMEIEVKVTYEFMNASVVTGSVKVNGKEACTTELKIFLTGGDAR